MAHYIVPVVRVSREIIERIEKARPGLVQKMVKVRSGTHRREHTRMAWVRPENDKPGKGKGQLDLFSGGDEPKKLRKYYVTMAREGMKQHAWLAGPYDTHEEALSRVDEARQHAHRVDPRSVFDAFGTASYEAEEGKHIQGKLNDLMAKKGEEPNEAGQGKKTEKKQGADHWRDSLAETEASIALIERKIEENKKIDGHDPSLDKRLREEKEDAESLRRMIAEAEKKPEAGSLIEPGKGGDRNGHVIHADGKDWLVMSSRANLISACPIVNGKPVVNAESKKQFDLRKDKVYDTGIQWDHEKKPKADEPKKKPPRMAIASPQGSGRHSEMTGALGVISKIHNPYLMKNPAGTWSYVGSVPHQLMYRHKDGTPLSDEEVGKIQSHGAGLFKDKIQRMTWKTPEEAMAAAKEIGYEAPDIESAQSKGLRHRDAEVRKSLLDFFRDGLAKAFGSR